MQRYARILILLGPLCAGMVHAETETVLTDEEWMTAARTSLALADRRTDAIVVVDDQLAPSALDALRQLRATIAVDELPDREEYELPPGNYLRVRTFAQSGDRIEFQSTIGAVRRRAGLNCGVTTHFFIKRDAQGTWKQDGLTSVSMC